MLFIYDSNKVSVGHTYKKPAPTTPKKICGTIKTPALEKDGKPPSLREENDEEPRDVKTLNAKISLTGH